MSRSLPLGTGLRERLGEPGLARRLSSSPRSRVWLVEFEGSPAIVKQIVGGPDAAGRYAREVTALRLAGRVQPPVVPVLLATDSDARVLVLEYLAGTTEPAEWVGYATALARLHASTGTGTGTGDAAALPCWAGPDQADVRAFLALADTLQVAVPDGVADELHHLLGRLRPGTGHALLHGDPCPGNVIQTPDGIRFIDLEQAALGNGLTELAYLRIGFPTCWCVRVVRPALLVEAETAYQAAWRSITGTELGGDLADACAGWLIRGDALVERAHRGSADHLARIPRQDWRWGTVTARERLLHRLGVVAAVCGDHPELRHLGQLSRSMHDRIRQRWPKLAAPPTS